MNLPTTVPNSRDLAWYKAECEALKDENERLVEQNRALRKMADYDSWSRELQEALDSIPIRFLANDYWVEGIRRMATAVEALQTENKRLRESLDLSRETLSDIHLQAHCIAKAGPLNTPTLQDAWGKFMEIAAKASGAAHKISQNLP